MAWRPMQYHSQWALTPSIPSPHLSQNRPALKTLQTIHVIIPYRIHVPLESSLFTCRLSSFSLRPPLIWKRNGSGITRTQTRDRMAGNQTKCRHKIYLHFRWSNKIMHYRMCVTRNRGVRPLGLEMLVAIAFAHSREWRTRTDPSTHPEPVLVGHTNHAADQLRHLSHSIRMASGIFSKSSFVAKRRKRLTRDTDRRTLWSRPNI